MNHWKLLPYYLYLAGSLLFVAGSVVMIWRAR